jgi:phage repressor protein C with HTH and peptisase S24 domain
MKTILLEYTDTFDDNKVKELTFSSHLIQTPFKESSLFCLMVDGQSMQPVINHKAVIVADLSQKTLEEGGIYLVYYENKMWVKKYRSKKEQFVSINPDYDHLVYNKKEVHLVAKVLLTFTNL